MNDNNEVVFTQPDVRNKLGSFKNLIALLKSDKIYIDDVVLSKLISKEIKECEKSIEYFSENKQL